MAFYLIIVLDSAWPTTCVIKQFSDDTTALSISHSLEANRIAPSHSLDAKRFFSFISSLHANHYCSRPTLWMRIVLFWSHSRLKRTASFWLLSTARCMFAIRLDTNLFSNDHFTFLHSHDDDNDDDANDDVGQRDELCNQSDFIQKQTWQWFQTICVQFKQIFHARCMLCCCQICPILMPQEISAQIDNQIN